MRLEFATSEDSSDFCVWFKIYCSGLGIAPSAKSHGVVLTFRRIDNLPDLLTLSHCYQCNNSPNQSSFLFYIMLLYAFVVSSMQMKILQFFFIITCRNCRGDLSIHKDLLNHEFFSASDAIGFFHLKFKPSILQIADS